MGKENPEGLAKRNFAEPTAKPKATFRAAFSKAASGPEANVKAQCLAASRSTPIDVAKIIV